MAERTRLGHALGSGIRSDSLAVGAAMTYVSPRRADGRYLANKHHDAYGAPAELTRRRPFVAKSPENWWQDGQSTKSGIWLKVSQSSFRRAVWHSAIVLLRRGILPRHFQESAGGRMACFVICRAAWHYVEGSVQSVKRPACIRKV